MTVEKGWYRGIGLVCQSGFGVDLSHVSLHFLAINCSLTEIRANFSDGIAIYVWSSSMVVIIAQFKTFAVAELSISSLDHSKMAWLISITFNYPLDLKRLCLR